MTARVVLTIDGLIMIVQGIAFYLFAEQITQNMFPLADTDAVDVGIVLRQLLAGGSIFVGVVLYSARTNVASAARRILFGASIGFTLLFLILLHILLSNDGVSIPKFSFITFGVLALVSFYYGDSGLKR